jgi:hypothetical protein
MNFDISHAVDDSDVAFVMRLDRKSTVCSMMSSRSTHYHKVGTNIDAFINLATLNYLLAGLQLCYVSSNAQPSRWFDLLHDLDQERYAEPGTQLTLWDLRRLTRELIVPFGVVRGSEKQGGQDETGLAAATFPVNFVCNLVLDGHERNVLNYWHYHDVSAGDDLVFRLKPMPIPKGKNGYTLNHYYKRFVQQNFESYFQVNLGAPHATHVWQLVPDVFTLDYKPENDDTYGSNGVVMSPGFDVPKDYVWQEHGFWHIARSQVMVRKYALCEYYNDDMANQMKTSHLDVTFEPMYTKVPGEVGESYDPRAVLIDARQDRVPTRRNAFGRRLADRVAPGVRAPAPPRSWAPELFLEGAASLRAAPSAPPPPSAAKGGFHELDMVLSPGPAAKGGFHELDMVLSPGTAAPASRQSADLSSSRQSAAVRAPLDYSIIFSDPPPLSLDPATVAAPAAGGGEDYSLPFSAGGGEDYSLPFSSPVAAASASRPAQGKAGKKRAKPQDEPA